MKIVMLNGQNHKGSTYHIGRMIADKIEGENEITEFFFPKDLILCIRETGVIIRFNR